LSGVEVDALWLRLAVGLLGAVLGAAWLGVLAVVEWAAWVLVLPSRRPGVLEAQVTFMTDPDCPERRLGEPIEATAADGVRLAGIWHAADEADPSALGRGRVVFLIHGFAEDPSSLRARMEALNRHGWHVAALDVRAHGRSGGDRGSFGGREAGDVSAWVLALSASGRLSADPAVAIWGRSMGAAIALRAAADDPRVAAVVLEAPYLDLEETFVRVLKRKRVPLAGLLARLVLRRASRLAGVPLARPRPVDVAPRVAAAAMVIHGADDPLIPAADARRLAQAFPRPAPYVEVAAAGHNSVVDVGGAPLLERVATFLDEAVARG
jgi:uncharacterized protein